MSGGRGRSPAVGAQLLDARPITGSTASGIGALSGVGLHVSGAGLSLTGPDGAEVRRWTWGDVEGWDADAVAADGDGGVRQVLTVRARPAPLVVLVDAGRLGPFLSVLSVAHAEGQRRAAKAARQTVVRSRRRRVAVAAACLALVGGIAGGVPALVGGSAPHSPGQRSGVLAGSFGKGKLHLPKATAPPAPAPASLTSAALAPHEAFGFLPYWALPDPSSVDLTSLTTVAYFSVDVDANGTVDKSQSSPGWVGYQSQALADFITGAHRDGQRAVLSATCFDQATLDALTHDASAQAVLAATLVALVRAKNLDGVNLDFEGDGPTDRTGLDQLVATVSSALHSADAAWQLTVDTYASSASDPGGFYDVAGMAPFVDAFVVMDYDMGGTFGAGPTSAMSASYSDQEVVSTYSDAAGASKVIVAMPLYGEDWPTVGPTAGDPATGPPTAVADDQITPDDTVYWDASTDGPWAVYQVGDQWHQVWFDDPASLAAKARMVSADHLRGVGLWALGMAEGTGDQESAVTGVAVFPQPADGPVTVWHGPLPKWGVPAAAGVGSNSTAPSVAGSAPAANAFGSGGSAQAAAATPAANGVFGGSEVSLVPWPGAVPTGTTAAGSLGTFSAPGTSVSCLARGPSLPVVQIDGTSAYIVEARGPADCATGTWAFVLPATTSSAPVEGGAGTSGSAQGAAGTSTGSATTSASSSSGTGSSTSSTSGGTGSSGGTTQTTTPVTTPPTGSQAASPG